MSHARSPPASSPRDELLIGQTINTNAGWMGERLGLIGIRPKRVRAIGDDRQEILDALARAECDVVLITGGLGPTKDDRVTKHTRCASSSAPAWCAMPISKRDRGLFENLAAIH